MPYGVSSVPTLGGQSWRWGGALPGPGGPSAPCGRSGLRGPLAPSAGIRPCCAPALPSGPLAAFGAWPCGAGVMLLMDAYLVNLDTTSDPTGLPSATVYGYRGLF